MERNAIGSMRDGVSGGLKRDRSTKDLVLIRFNCEESKFDQEKFNVSALRS